jgi:hypothetical protein
MSTIKHSSTFGLVGTVIGGLISKFGTVLSNIFGKFGSVIFNTLKHIILLPYKGIRLIFVSLWKAIWHIIKLPLKLLPKSSGTKPLGAHPIAVTWWWTKHTAYMGLCAVLHVISSIIWWIKHQLSLTNINDLRGDVKPVFSFFWALRDELSPRHKLDFWLGDSHVTVEVRSYKYYHKTNTLVYYEHGSKKRTQLHSPQGITHMATHLHWWNPIVPFTITPYTPLHAIPNKKLVK